MLLFVVILTGGLIFLPAIGPAATLIGLPLILLFGIHCLRPGRNPNDPMGPVKDVVSFVAMPVGIACRAVAKGFRAAAAKRSSHRIDRGIRGGNAGMPERGGGTG